MKKTIPYFSQNPLNRLDHIRRDKTALKKLFAKKETKFLLFYNNALLMQGDTYLFSQEIVSTCKYNKKESVLLGEYESRPYFALQLQEKKEFQEVDLRNFAQSSLAKESMLGILAQASSVFHWHNTHTFCSFCGEKTEMSHGGWRRDCQACQKQHFPRTDPVVIMLTTHGEYTLLGKGKRFKQNRYSCLAGFMESGESIEDAARRELFEEAGVIGEEVTYIASQPWPFPSNLMIGVHVKAKSKELLLDPFEIADAKWLHKEEVKALLQGDKNFGFELPGFIAIARNLLEFWVQE